MIISADENSEHYIPQLEGREDIVVAINGRKCDAAEIDTVKQTVLGTYLDEYVENGDGTATVGEERLLEGELTFLVGGVPFYDWIKSLPYHQQKNGDRK